MKQTLTSIPAALRLRTPFMLFLLCVVVQLQATVRYVKQGGSGDGSSWANASANLQAMINASGAGDEVWVAAGTYKPTSCTTCSFSAKLISFSMRNGVAIYGGFPNSGNPGFGNRNWATNVTTLSGDINNDGTLANNSYHVISNNGLDNTAILDGFTISGGNADLPPEYSGGGMRNAYSSPTVTNCAFSGNSASVWGAGMSNDYSSPAVTNCSFFGNSASYGSGMYNSASSPTLTNCTFFGNSASYFGGGMLNAESSATLNNCILWGNGSEIYNISSNPTVTYSIVQGGCPAGATCTNVLNADPLFISATNLRLQACSPAIDAGTASGAPATDLDGNARVDAITGGSNVDMGAYEYQGDLDLDNDGYAYCGGIDCNDDNAAINPSTVWYLDSDNDGYSNGSTLTQCAQPSGYKLAANLTATSGDCNDANFNIKPSATEICDGVDNNCVGGIDEGNVCCPSGILYVNDDASGLNNGSSWTNAFTSLQSALASTCPGVTQIWVAAGTYKPTSTNARTISFVMKNNLAIYGGFVGNEPSNYNLNLRNFIANTSTLSGEIGAAGNSDNSFHVINNSGLNSTAVLDGFIITAGTAGIQPNSFGGGMYNTGSSPSLSNCIFTGNTSVNQSGGGMYNNNSSSPSLTNCIFLGNSANFNGGAIGNTNSSSPTLSNCTLSGNSAGSGAVANSFSSIATFKNCILWGNSGSFLNVNGGNAIVTYSIVQSGYAGTGNLNADPLFVSATNLRLQACSPAIDAGTATGAPSNDLDGNARPHDAAPNVPGNFDMGAYEFQGSTAAPVAHCQPITVQLDANHTVSVTGSEVNTGSSGCGTLSFLLNGQASLSFDCDDVGIPQSVTLTLTDYFANTATCPATLTVADDDNPCCAAPNAVCQNATVYLDGNGEAALSVSNVNNGSTYECGLDEMTVSPSAFDCSHIGAPQTVTLTVTDINGNTNTCTATVTVQDNTQPSVTCKPYTVQLGASGNASITTANVYLSGSDNCGTVNQQGVSPNSFTCANLGSGNTVTLTVNDGHGNTKTCAATVTVQDNTQPSVVCKNHTVSLSASGTAGIAPADVFQSGSDNCGTVNPASVSPSNFSCSNVGGNLVTLTVNDGHGNTNTCTATVTVTLDNATAIAYTLLAQEEVHMHKTTVNGNVGVWQVGKDAKIHDYSTVSGFVKAPMIDLDNNAAIGGGQLLEQAPQPGTFRYNTQADPPSDVNVPDNYPGVYQLSGSLFRKIEVGKNSTVQFMASGDIFIKEFKTKDADNGNHSSVVFSGNTELVVRKKVELGKRTEFNWGGAASVNVYVEEDDLKVKESSKVNASLDVRFKSLIVEDADEALHTLMTGQFIAKKIDSGKWVDWDWSPYECGSTPPPAPLVAPNGDLGLAATLDDLQVGLHWATNMAGEMEVERSTDGANFSTLLHMASDASASATKRYRDYDPNPSEGVNYYRVKLVQPDGSVAYSPIRQVVFNLESDFTVFPNPASDRVQVHMKRFLGKEVDLVIADNLGQELYRQHIAEVTDKLLRIELDRSTFGEGLYSISIIHRGRAQSKRLVLLRAD